MHTFTLLKQRTLRDILVSFQLNVNHNASDQPCIFTIFKSTIDEACTIYYYDFAVKGCTECCCNSGCI